MKGNKNEVVQMLRGAPGIKDISKRVSERFLEILGGSFC